MTDDFTTSFLHFSMFSTALWDLQNSRPVHSLMLSSHLFFCLPCLLPAVTVPCKMGLDRPDERETCPYHFSLHLFTMVRRSSCVQLPAGSRHRLLHGKKKTNKLWTHLHTNLFRVLVHATLTQSNQSVHKVFM